MPVGTICGTKVERPGFRFVVHPEGMCKNYFKGGYHES